MASTARKGEGSKLRALEKRLAEALKQQTATSEILRVISSSPADLQPVLDAIVANAARLCDSIDAQIFRVDGDVLRPAASHGSLAKISAGEPRPINRGSVNGRAVVDRRTIHVHDLAAESESEWPEAKAFQKRFGHRTTLATPLLRDGVPLGAITIRRTEVRPFSDDQIKLLETFADQAVIAIENVRLFTDVEKRNHDLTEALEQQTATSEILRVISQSPTNVQPVFDTIVAAALKLCSASSANVFTFDGKLIHLAAFVNVDPEYVEAMRQLFPRPPSRDTGATRAVLTRSVITIPDVLEDREYVSAAPRLVDNALAAGFRSVLAVPLMREGGPIGAIAVGRPEPGRFPDQQIALLKTFADQAVIAIENVRLFTQLEARNRDLTEALEQQTATSGILRVISRSPTDVQPVFDTIAAAALKLCAATSAVVTRFDGEFLRVAALANVSPEGAEAVRARYPRPPGRYNAASRAVLTRSVVAIPDVLEDAEYEIKGPLLAAGFRSIVAVPLMREGSPMGAITVVRPVPGAFPEKQIALLQTFADQAVIAIENARLFAELEKRNCDLTEALEQQTATSEILRVISQSPRDVQPVFDTIAAAALKLCGVSSALVTTFDGQLVSLAAVANVSPEAGDALRDRYPRPASRDTATARAILTRSAVIIPDVLEDPEYAVREGTTGSAGDFRSILCVPMLRQGTPIGAIGVGRPEPGPYSNKQIALLQTFADQAVIAIENVRLFNETQDALERQTATAEILKVISRSPTDVQPVFDAIAASARRLCAGTHGAVLTYDGSLVHLSALNQFNPEGAESLRRAFPMAPSRASSATRAILYCEVINIADVLEDNEYVLTPAARASGYRSVVAVPMLRDGNPTGVITVTKAAPGSFPDKQVELLKTFADQAVIAIENVRLFTELQKRNRGLSEALEQQTATSEILRVISQSPTDVQPVFDTIAEAALKLCHVGSATVVTFDGELIHARAVAAVSAQGAQAVRNLFPRLPSPDITASRAILTNAVVMIPDVLEDPAFAFKSAAVAGGFRATLSVPLIREGTPIGAVTLGRPEPGPFADTQIALLKTFADQAVIAIENVRLFTELEKRNHDLTEALEQQTATSEILRVISQSPRDVQPVFDTIAAAALKLCRASSGLVFTFDGKLIHLAADANMDPEAANAWRKLFPRPPSRDTAVTRAILTCSVVAVPDALEDPEYVVAVTAAATGFRSALAVPLIRDRQPIGAVGVGRFAPGPFPENQIALLQTFADQAVIAIENVRLFTELEARTAQLTRSVGELKALGEVGQAVSSTLDLETVLRTIVSRATQLAGMDGGSIWEYDDAGEEFHLHATDRLPQELIEVLRATPIRKGEGALGRLAMTAEPVEIRDFADERSYRSRLRQALLRSGYRSVVAVPLLREDRLLGALAVNRKSPGEFEPQIIDLLKTFAAQSALAIQNARLFREIEDKSRQLQIASQHKSEFLANMSHELRTPLNAILGFSEVLAERMFGEVNEKQAEYLNDILESGRHLLSLINDILDLSKIEAGRMELEPTDFDLPSAIENALILVRERAQRRDIALTRKVNKQLGKVHADERKVKQVLLNLLSNALKFTPEGGHIDVRAEMRDGVAEISVTDTGVGIAPEDQKAVFEEFRQVGTASKKVEGTGLGLAISRKFIELHGGRIWVTSQLGKGSTFTFTLPLH